METNGCDVNGLDADSLLPPRKRLLAGLKRQNACVDNEYHELLSSPLKSWLSDPNLSHEEIFEASRIAAIEASRIAVAARVNAEEKAAKAAKAVLAAKNALELVSDLSEDTDLADKYFRKNKFKKQRPVTALYRRSKDKTDNRATDEELARKLHQSINSSPRISKNPFSTDAKIHHQQTRLRSSAGNYKEASAVEPNCSCTATSNGNVNKIDMLMIDLNASKPP